MKFILYPIKLLAFIPVYFYKYCLSPLLPHRCRFTPTCSSYMIMAINEFGVIKGVLMGLKRISRCVPWNKKYGYDPIPTNIKGEHKWLF